MSDAAIPEDMNLKWGRELHRIIEENAFNLERSIAQFALEVQTEVASVLRELQRITGATP